MVAMEKLVGYFGYGSLVNRKTLRTSYVDAARAELKGYRREWKIRGETVNGPVCSLTAARDPALSIQGLVVVDRAENLPKVDEREARYDRISISVDDLDLEQDVEVAEFYVYLAKPVHLRPNDGTYRILQSYVDAVMQGYLIEFGRAGLERFVSHTHGWDQNILADRHDPKYARAVELSEAEQQLFDGLLRKKRETVTLSGS